MKNKNIFLSICLIITITTITFSPVLKNDFTLWDDNIYITENNFIQTFSLENIQKIFTTFLLGNYHPFTLFSFLLEYSIFGANPHAYHLTNVIVHFLNCILVFWLTVIFSKKISVALLTTLLFGLHPLRVEPVAWISGRKDLLFAFFFLISFISYLYYQNEKRLKYLYFSLASFACSLLSKGMGVTLPFMLIVSDYYFQRQFNKKIILEKIPYFLIALIFGSLTLIARLTYESSLRENVFSIFDRIAINIHRLVFYYLARVVAPLNLSLLNPQKASNLPLPFAVFIFFAVLIIGCLTIIVIFLKKHSRHFFFGSLFFIITILPVLTVVVLGYSADRFTYIPSIGLFYLTSQGIVHFFREKRKYWKGMSNVLLISVCGLIGLLSFITWKRCHVWKNSVSLESYFIKHYSNDPRLYRNRGVAYEKYCSYESAIADFSKALEIDPSYTDAYMRRGNIFVSRGLYDAALNDFNKAIEVDPCLAEAYHRRGMVYYRLREYEYAIIDFSSAININRIYEEAYYNRGIVYSNMGEYNKAIADFSNALKIKPDYTEAYVNRGIMYGLSGKYVQAISDFSQAIRNEPNFAEAYNNRGFAYNQIGKYELAIADFSQVIEFNPNNAGVYKNRGFAYSQIGEYELAMDDFSHVLKLNPNDTLVKRNISILEEKAKSQMR